FHQVTVHAMLSNPQARARVARSLLEECRRHSYYGFQLDFENIPATDRENLTTLVRDTAALLGTEGFRLSIAVMYQASAERPASGYQRWLWDQWLGAYDLREIARHVEFLSVMTYDQHTERTPPGPIAAYPWVEQVLDFCLQQAPKEKLSLGIPLYGRRWHTGLLRGEGSQAAASVNHHEALELAAQHHAAPIWDELERAPWFWFYRDGLREYVFYNDGRSFRERYELTRQRGLHGFSAWVLGAEDPEIWKALPARTANPRE
ncbi:MAG: glycosyl hydrolase, partial [Acidobacteria bacterium]|nr:glycosyl hydrolase [Acidobacteriota bacterium]